MYLEKVEVILTGGTIDSIWDPTIDTVTPTKRSAVKTYLEHLSKVGKIYIEFKFTQICWKDSRNLTMGDVDKIYKAVAKSQCKKIIIAHGSYTMPDTARFIKNKLGKTNKIILLTGSLIPLQDFQNSDAQFNLGYSVAQLEYLKPGVYICYNAHTFKPDEVAKNLPKGQFYSVLRNPKH
jgi:L-asparaginase